MEKTNIIKKFLISKKTESDFQQYLDILAEYNSHTNLVGRSTLVSPWNSHILDSLQLMPFIKNKNLSILDMGTGAGFPGNVLSIAGCKNVTLVDSNGKKINFLKLIKNKMNLKTKIILSRIEALSNIKYDIITCRALASLDKIFSYSQKLLKKNTVLILLKGKTVNDEIEETKKKWTFQLDKHQSISDYRGSLLIIKNINKND